MKLNDQKTNSPLKSLCGILSLVEEAMNTAYHEPGVVGARGLGRIGDLPYDTDEGWRAGWEMRMEWLGKTCGALPSVPKFLQHQLVYKEREPPPGSAEV